MPGFLSELTNYYHTLQERHRNLPFLKGAMAACALTATVDGEITLSERLRVDQIIEALEALKVFDPHEGVNLFNGFSEDIFRHPKKGQKKALKVVTKVAEEDPEKAELMIRICLAVGDANGTISLAEQVEIVTLCGILNVEPQDCGLYTDSAATGIVAKTKLKRTRK